MRISDWSSDVCSSDLSSTTPRRAPVRTTTAPTCTWSGSRRDERVRADPAWCDAPVGRPDDGLDRHLLPRVPSRDRAARPDCKTAVYGRGVFIRVELGELRVFKKKTKDKNQNTT